MLIPAAVTIFLIGLGGTLWQLMRFEARVRRAWQEHGLKQPDRAAVGATLRRVILFSVVSGLGIGLLGMSAFIWGRTSSPGLAAYLWAALFAIAACLGWPMIVVMAFMARVNSLERFGRK